MNQSHTILAVDDEPVNLRTMERLLRGHFTVITANSGEEALKIFQEKQVSLLITDQRMPGMLGTELLRKCKAINPDMVGILVTATNDNNLFIDAIKNSGVIRVINKPWDPDKMLSAIHDALAKYERTLENKLLMSRLQQMNENLERVTKPH